MPAIIEFCKKHKEIILTVFAAVFMLFSVSIVIFYTTGPSIAFFHSDCADSLYWASASRDSKSLFNKDFGYAAFLPFGGTTIMYLLEPFFGQGITTHRVGMAVFVLIMLFAVFFLLLQSDKSKPFSLFSTGLLALTLFSSSKMREIFFEHTIYYSISCVGITILLLLYFKLGDIDLSIKKHRIKAAVAASFTALYSFLLGMDGFQIVASAVFPVIFAVIFNVIRENKPLKDKSNILPAAFSAVTGILSLLGVFVVKYAFKAFSGYASAYSTYSNTSDWVNNARKLPEHWFYLFGIDFEIRHIDLFGVDSIKIGIRIVASLVIALVPVVALFFIKKLKQRTCLILFSHFGTAAVILFGYIMGTLSSAAWRLSPLIFTGLISTLCVINDLRLSITLKRLGAISLAFVIALGIVNIGTFNQIKNYGITENSKFELLNELSNNNLDFGYATFWSSQTVTVLSDAKIRCVNVNINENGVEACPYQSDKRWFNENASKTGKYFLALTKNEVDTLKESEEYSRIFRNYVDIIFTPNWQIFIFDSNFFVRN
ncbi:MAG: hypothetical protein K6B52_04335 [Clostridiales bacterium]|nr:hypothetical protein [Clostridiales bacterium]